MFSQLRTQYILPNMYEYSPTKTVFVKSAWLWKFFYWEVEKLESILVSVSTKISFFPWKSSFY